MEWKEVLGQILERVSCVTHTHFDYLPIRSSRWAHRCSRCWWMLCLPGLSDESCEISDQVNDDGGMAVVNDYLSIACLEAKVKEATNAILSSSGRVIHDETEAERMLA